ncbi:MAG: SUMF1/EgtB/PvdO family nonheme iron enzyme, partial [Candidatus Caenarcaniphilales bacterium]|nr:SUMF1/EgtB/PvdO family nonheme iron enzyme [Candidatus Caenarcaniphilales bacterium]
VYDIQGNTMEWVLDKAYLQENSVNIRKGHYPEAATDWYSANGDYPLARGGTNSIVLSYTYFSLSGSTNYPDFQSPSVGFRIVQEIDT